LGIFKIRIAGIFFVKAFDGSLKFFGHKKFYLN
jgi:hypothetical protein